MRTINKAWVQDLGTSWCGHEFAISTERHDGIVYTAGSAAEAVRKYEADKQCEVKEFVIA